MLERLRELHAEGLSFRRIAAGINAEFSTVFTRNACVGKSRRLGLTPRPSPLLPKKDPERRKVMMKKPVSPAPPLAPETPPIGALLITDLHDGCCHWPFGEHPAISYCGKPVAYRLYCQEHCERSYVTPLKRWAMGGT
jgi:GcrA cell cycle regulator